MEECLYLNADGKSTSIQHSVDCSSLVAGVICEKSLADDDRVGCYAAPDTEQNLPSQPVNTIEECRQSCSQSPFFTTTTTPAGNCSCLERWPLGGNRGSFRISGSSSSSPSSSSKLPPLLVNKSLDNSEKKLREIEFKNLIQCQSKVKY